MNLMIGQLPLPLLTKSILQLLLLLIPSSYIVMGPDQESTVLPNRPRFTWDIRYVPWTDDKGNEDEYRKSVALWRPFPDKLPDNNSNKIPTELRGIILQSQLYGRAKDLSDSLDDTQIQSTDGSTAIVNAIYKRDALSVVSGVYQNILSLLTTKRGEHETVWNLESRFNAQVTKFNAMCSSVKLSEAIISFMLLANASIDSTKRVSILSATSKVSSTNDDSNTDDYFKSVSYEKVGSVLTKCNNGKYSDTSSKLLEGNAIYGGFQSKYGNNSGKKKLTAEQLQDLKSRIQCHRCQKCGHNDHISDICSTRITTYNIVL